LSEDYVKFTVNLPRDLHKRAKIRAAEQETTLADVIRNSLEEFVGAPHQEIKERPEKEEDRT
jgi:predicted HicB family RNase H-like nuclease